MKGWPTFQDVCGCHEWNPQPLFMVANEFSHEEVKLLVIQKIVCTQAWHKQTSVTWVDSCGLWIFVS